VNNVSLNRRFVETDDEEEACRLLFNEYYETVFNAIDRMLGNHSDLPVDADDITGETFTKAFYKRKEIRYVISIVLTIIAGLLEADVIRMLKTQR
jgi:hypothetical protein